MIKLKDLLNEVNISWRSTGREPREVIDAIHHIIRAVHRAGEKNEDWILVSQNGNKWGIFRPKGAEQAAVGEASNFALVFDYEDASWSIMWLPGKKMQAVDDDYLPSVLDGWIEGF